LGNSKGYPEAQTFGLEIENVGQIEIDVIYFGISKKGAHYVIPCQAKSPGDRFGIVQVMQDIEFGKQRNPSVLHPQKAR
jgi:hypothetical protein